MFAQIGWDWLWDCCQQWQQVTPLLFWTYQKLYLFFSTPMASLLPLNPFLFLPSFFFQKKKKKSTQTNEFVFHVDSDWDCDIAHTFIK